MGVSSTSEATPLLSAANRNNDNNDEIGSNGNDSASGTSLPTTITGKEQRKVNTVSVTKNQLGTFKGVYVPCVLSIFGVVLFLRLGWSVGHVGLLNTLGIMAFAGLVDMLTIMSVSAISTTGKIKGGGPYYLISRSLGPAFGGSAGIMFFLANAIGVTFYLTGFVETAVSAFNLNFASCYWMEFTVGSIVLLIVTFIALVGAQAYTDVASFILIFKVLAIIIGFLSFLLRSPETANVLGFYGLKNVSSTLHRNLYSFDGDFGDFPNTTSASEGCGAAEGGDIEGKSGILLAFGVLFPAFTGIMAGANMSGDLANPGKSIYQGSIAGIGTAMLVYLALIMAQSCTVDQRVLVVDYNIMQKVAPRWWLVGIGIFCSTFASALASIIGASRILQALARDELIGALRIFGYGSEKGDEPRVAIIATWVIAQGALFIGNLNKIAPILSMFFLMNYAVINFAVFVLTVSGAPNFRPSFRYFSWQTAIVGFLLSVVVMFLLDVVSALMSMGILLCSFLYIYTNEKESGWGEVSQAIIFHQVRKYLLRLDERKEHIKNWRPGVLLIIDEKDDKNDIKKELLFANELKKGGLFVIGKVFQDALTRDFDHQQAIADKCLTEKLEWMHVIDMLNIKAFVQIMCSPSTRLGVFAIVQSAGLGGMVPNTLCFNIPNNFQDRQFSPSNFVTMMEDAHALRKNIVLTHGMYKLDRDEIVKKRFRVLPTIDVWVNVSLNINCKNFINRNTVNNNNNSNYNINNNADDNVDPRMGCSSSSAPYILIDDQDDDWETWQQSSLLLQLASITHATKFWKKHTALRVCTIVDYNDQITEMTSKITELLKTYRIPVYCVKVFSVEQFGLLGYVNGGNVSDDSSSKNNLYNAVEQTGTLEKTFSNRPNQSLSENHDENLRVTYVANKILRHASKNTAMHFVSLPTPLPTQPDKADQYWGLLDNLIDESEYTSSTNSSCLQQKTYPLPTVAFVYAQEGSLTNEM